MATAAAGTPIAFTQVCKPQQDAGAVLGGRAGTLLVFMHRGRGCTKVWDLWSFTLQPISNSPFKIHSKVSFITVRHGGAHSGQGPVPVHQWCMLREAKKGCSKLQALTPKLAVEIEPRVSEA